MPSFLSDSEFNEIRSAILDTTDTFLKKPVTYKRASSDVLDPFNEDRIEQAFEDINLLGLIVFASSSQDALITETKQGSYDYSMGYCLFNYEDCENEYAGLVADNEFIGRPEQDYLFFDNARYKIEGVNLVADLNNKYVLVKIHFRKDLQNG